MTNTTNVHTTSEGQAPSAAPARTCLNYSVIDCSSQSPEAPDYSTAQFGERNSEVNVLLRSEINWEYFSDADSDPSRNSFTGQEPAEAAVEDCKSPSTKQYDDVVRGMKEQQGRSRKVR